MSDEIELSAAPDDWDRIRDLLSRGNGAKTTDLAAELSMDPLRVRALLMAAEKRGEAWRTGQTRGTRWFTGLPPEAGAEGAPAPVEPRRRRRAADDEGGEIPLPRAARAPSGNGSAWRVEVRVKNDVVTRYVFASTLSEAASAAEAGAGGLHGTAVSVTWAGDAFAS